MFTSNLADLKAEISTSAAVYNYLRPNAFRFTVRDIPNISYTCQSANLPALSLGFAQQTTPFIDIPRFGDKLNYGDFTIRFIIAEDMSNYIEIAAWIEALGFPQDYAQYPSYVAQKLNRFPGGLKGPGATDAPGFSDGTLTILDSNNAPKTNIIFRDLFPVSIEGFDFDVTSSTVEYFIGVASFKYKTFSIEPL